MSHQNSFAASGVVKFTIRQGGESTFEWMRPVVGIVPALSGNGDETYFYTPLIVSDQGNLIEAHIYQAEILGGDARPDSVYLPHVVGPISDGPKSWPNR